MNRPRFPFFALALAGAVAGCSSGGAASGTMPAVQLPSQAAPAPRATAATALYVSSFRGITEYDPATGALLRTIVKHVDIPVAMAFDSQGTLYVANGAGGPHGQGAIEVIPAGSNHPSREIRTGLNGPFALAVDAAGDLYAANQYGKSVTVYAPGSSVPSRRIADHLSYPIALAIDPKNGDLYVASSHNGGWITKYAAGGTMAVETITAGIDLPLSIALDASGNLYVANDLGSTVTSYRNGSPNLWQTFAHIVAPQSLAMKSDGTLYVGAYHKRIYQMDAATGAVLATLKTKLVLPRSMALDATGSNLAVAEYGWGSQTGEVAIFDTATGKLAHTLTNGVLSPTGVLFGPR